jgi:hypothetical protein
VHLRVLALSVLFAAPFVAVPAHAAEPDPAAPVVVDDAVSAWPGGTAEVDVLANDSDPGGDDLALCRMPPLETESSSAPVTIVDESIFGGPVGTIAVQTSPRAYGTYVLDYYVCNHTRLSPAHLTVTVRPVEPVDVVPGRRDHVRVTNHNDRAVVFAAFTRDTCDLDTIRRVGAHHTRSIEVHHRSLQWMAVIGDHRSSGIADHGTVRGIELSHPDHHPHGIGSGCMIGIALRPTTHDTDRDALLRELLHRAGPARR